jgi:hypothetical protein
MQLGYPHPDVMLASMTARQAAEWYAYATIEQVGNPVSVEDPKAVAKARRARVEAGFRSLMEKNRG